jgi:hypothetical protein
MKTAHRWFWGGLLFASVVAEAAPISSAFTYQGQLTERGSPANGSYDLQFRLFDAPSGGSSWHLVLTNADVTVSNGLFTTTLDFGPDPFEGTARWLEIGVRAHGSGEGFALLDPRQSVTANPYALHAASAGNAFTATLANGVAPNAVTVAGIVDSNITSAKIAAGQVVKSLNQLEDDVLLGAGTNITMAISGNMIVVSSPTWSLTGNRGTTPDVNYLGTADDQPLDFKVNGVRALRLRPNGIGVPNVIGGSGDNFVSGGVAAATIGGGGGAGAQVNSVGTDSGTVAGGSGNMVRGVAGTVGGGAQNVASNNWATVSGGSYNLVTGERGSVGGGFQNTASGDHSTVSGGNNNTASGPVSTVSGGARNVAEQAFAAVVGGVGNVAAGPGSFVGGGGYDGIAYEPNVVSGADATIGGGFGNTNEAASATVAGGIRNRVHPGANSSVIGGGYTNKIESHAFESTIAGGSFNTIGTNAYSASIGGGYLSTVSAASATIAGGYMNLAEANAATVAGGANNSASGAYSAVAGGGANAAVGNNSFVAGGDHNIADGVFSLAGGSWAKARLFGQQAFSGGSFDATKGGGDAQSSVYVLRNGTTGSGMTELFLDGAGLRLSLPIGSTWAFEVLVVGRTQDAGEFSTTQSGGFRIWGVIQNAGGGTSMPGASGEVLYRYEPSWGAYAEADDVHNALVIKVVGGSIPMRWVATVRTSEVLWSKN